MSTTDGPPREDSFRREPPLPVSCTMPRRVSSTSLPSSRSEEHTSELQSRRDLAALPTRRSSNLDDEPTAKGGFLSKRTSFPRLMHDAAQGLFDVVTIVDLDRLTRSEDLRERGEVLGAFQRAGVQIAVSGTGQVLDLRSSVGDLMSSLGTFFAAEANRKHRERIKRGKDEAIRKGKKPAGPTPFGYLYNRETGEWSVDPELGPIVVEIVTRVSQGDTCDAIARDLQARGVPRCRPSKSGRRRPGVWLLERVHQIVRARTYLGSWVADKARGLSIPIPRLVTDTLYARADAALLRAGRRGQPRNPHKYLLQGFSSCSLCGGAIGCASTGSWMTRQGKRRHFYYVCSRRRRPRNGSKACTLPMIRSEAIDDRFWNAIVEGVISDSHIEKAIAEHGAETQTDPDPRVALSRLEGRVKQLTRAEEILLERFGRGLITDAALDKELVRLKADRTSVQEAIAAAQRVVGRHDQAARTGTALRKAIAELRGRLRTATTQDRRDIVRAIVAGGENGVKIGSERIEAEILLAPQGPPTFAQVYTAG